MTIRKQMTTVKFNNFIVLIIIALAPSLYAQSNVIPQAMYPRSNYITGISFDMSTLKNTCPGNNLSAPGSDNWTITWADDGHQYTSWGDGGGFGGNNRDGRSSMGIARVEGDKETYSGYNLWGGKNSKSIAQFAGKCYGILSVDGLLYLWRSGKSSECYGTQELRVSSDHGLTWDSTEVSWEFSRDEKTGFFVPTFLQFGQDHQGARDRYIYSYATEHTQSINRDTSDPNSQWDVNRPGEIILIRVPKNSIARKSSYRYFAGLKENGWPKWSKNLDARVAVFKDDQNGVMRTSVIFNPGLHRYIMIAQQVGRFKNLKGRKAYIGIYEAPEPWGPWSTVLFEHPWVLGDPPHVQNETFMGEAKTVYWNFSPKWWFDGGKGFVLVYTGPGGDQWGTVEGHFQIAE